MTGGRCASRLLSVLLACSAPGPADAAEVAAQPREDTPASSFAESIDVNVVNIEVFVVDDEGRRVTGLTRDDFELREDGRPIEITNFFAVSRPDRVIASLPAPGEPVPPAPPAVPAEQQLNLVVYIDHFNILPVNLARVLADLAGFVEDRAFQGDNVMVVSFDRRLAVVQPFTRDRARMLDAVERVARRGGTHRVLQQRTLRNALASINVYAAGEPEEGFQVGLGDGADIGAAYALVRAHVQEARQDLRLSARALESMVRALAGLPGRKALLYVSDGLPQRPGEVLYQHLADAFGAAAVRAGSSGPTPRLSDPYLENLQEDESQLFNDLVREANANQITLYTLDASSGGGSTLGMTAADADLSRNAGGSSALAALESQNLQEPLIAMAVGTGGASILNTANFDRALADLAADFDSFYSLGYQAPEAGDGGYHRIEVRVKRPGFTVRHRRGYVDKPEVDRIADRTFASLYLELEQNPLGVSVEFGRPEKEGRDRFKLPLLVRVPLRAVTLLPNGAEHRGQLEIFLVVEDEHGVSELQRVPYPIAFPTAQLAEALGRDAGYGAVLRLRRGLPTVAVGVWDRLGGGESFVQKQVIVEEDPSRSR
jgi:VWFA-related protein